MKHIRVDDETGCWLWTGFKARKGYGGLQLRGPVGAPRQSRIVLAHRLSYEAFNGPIRAGMLVCHSCDTPHCVNPKHLWLGTHQDNCDDKMRKGRHQSQRKAVSRTGVTGVIKRGDKYIAQIKVKGRCNQLGQFSTLADAAECRRRGEISVYGGFSPAMRGSAP